MIASNVTTRDNGLLDRITSVARRFTTKVEVGYFGKMHKPPITRLSARPIALKDLAAIHEFGLGVPKRAFIEPALKENRRKYLVYAGKQITPIIRRRQTLDNAWKGLGVIAVADIQKYMMTASFTPLAPSTIKRKGSSKPLIDTSQMYKSITYRVK